MHSSPAYDFEVSADVTLGEVWRLYKRVRRLKESTIADYQKRLHAYIPDLLTVPITSLSKSKVIALHEWLKDNAGATTAGYVFRILRALLEFAKEALETHDGKPVITTNVVKVLSATRGWNRQNRRTDYIKPNELKPFLTAVLRFPNASVSDWLLFILLTGCRRSEATRLEWGDVDFANAQLTFRNTKNGNHHAIPVSTAVLTMLQRRWLGASIGTNSYVFAGMAGGRLSATNQSNRLIAKDSGVSVSVHGLRRTYATCADAVGVPKSVIVRLLGHSPRDVTDGYIITSPETLRKHTQAVTDEILRLAEAPKALAQNTEAQQCLKTYATFLTTL